MKRLLAAAALLFLVTSVSPGQHAPTASGSGTLDDDLVVVARDGDLPSFALGKESGPQQILGGGERTLKSYTFELLTNPDPQGWTTHDLTAQIGNFFHVDNFATIIGQPMYVPIAGTKSLWCGAAGPLESYGPLPGYGNRWTQALASRAFAVVNPASDYVLQFKEKHHTSGGDKIDVQFLTESNRWHTLLTISGGPTLIPTTQTLTAPKDSLAATVQFRFLMTSNYAQSDEDGLLLTSGAIIIDDLTLTNGAFTADTENFEGEAVGALITTDHDWFSMGANGIAPFGDYAGLVDGDTVLQEGTTPDNSTHVWSFFNGSTENYACGGNPEQLAIPHTSVPGSTVITEYLDNEIRSPWILLATDKDGVAVPAHFSKVRFRYDVYADNPLDNLIFWRERYRFKVAGVPGIWNESFLYYSNSAGWLSLMGLEDAAIPPGATEFQLAIEVIDRCGQSCGGLGTGTCHSHAPLFDNISISRIIPPLVVSNANNTGGGSLRQAILDANADPDTSYINFGFLSTGPHTITPLSALPTITEPVVIDGFTQSGSSRNTHSVGQPSNAVIMIFLSGVNAGPNAPGLHASADADIYGLDVSGFSSYGMLLAQGSFAVEGCHIGVSGANALDGIYLDEADGSRIGGAPAGTHNVISGNAGNGISVNKTHNALIQGNYIGVAPDGTSNLGNGNAGIEMLDDAKFNTIGGAPNSDCTPVPVRAANVIAHNGSDGVTISDVGFIDAERNKIWSNSIHSNGRLGIDLLPNGVTPNDAGDVDTGANQRQNFPSISSAEDTLIAFTMLGKPSTTYLYQFFRSVSCDASGNGEGSVYLSQVSLATNASGSGVGSIMCRPIPPNSAITATATDPLGNTSEFSPCVVSQNTTTGTNEVVGIPDEAGSLLANITFASITSAGNTFATPGAAPPDPVPGSFLIGGTPTYYDISTTAVFNTTLGVDVCLHYDEATLPGDENDVVLLHYDSVLGDWVDVTTGRNTTTNFVCGHVSTFSPFVVAVPNPSTDIGDTPAPRTFALHHAVPNPFNPQTTIGFDLASSAHVKIDIFDVSGRLVRTLLDERRAAGRWSVRWTGDDVRGKRVASGVYFYRMQAGSFVETRKMVLLK